MRVFVTGASGFVGQAVVRELLSHGHTVLGLARSDAAAQVVSALGAQVHRGELGDLASLRAGAAACDGVIHCGFVHDFARPADICQIDRDAINALGAELAKAGPGRPLVVTSGIALFASTTAAADSGSSSSVSELTEAVSARDGPASATPMAEFRRKSEEAALALAARGVRVSVVRLPPSVHSATADRHGFVPMLIAAARAQQAAVYVSSTRGLNRWPAVHVLDAAALFRLALERAPAASVLHAVADSGIAFRDIATAIGSALRVPVCSRSPADMNAAAVANPTHAFIGLIAAVDCPANSERTQQLLDWHPTQPGLLDELAPGSDYYALQPQN